MKEVDRDIFIEENMGLVGMVVKKYIKRIENHACVDWEDLSQIGAIGLMKAYDRFDPDYGAKFSTYAVPMIGGEIQRFIRDDLDMIKFSRRAKSNYYKISAADLLNEKPAKISELLNIPVKQVEEALDYYRGQYPYSLEMPVGDNGEGATVYLGDKIGYEVDFISNMELEDFLGQFDDKTQKAMKLRLLNMSQKEVGKAMGISQVQVSRILQEAKDQLEEGGISVKKEKRADFTLAKKLAIETDSGPTEISRKANVSYSTASNYIREYRATREKIKEYEAKVRKEEAPVRTQAINKGIEVEERMKEVEKVTALKHRIDIPKEVISGLKESPADGFMTMTFNLTTENATSQLEDIVSAMKVLGFKDINLTIQSQQTA